MPKHRASRGQHHGRPKGTVRVVYALALAVVGLGVVQIGHAASAQATSVCSGATTPVYETFNPTTKSTLLTPSLAESQASTARYGYAEDHGVAFSGFTSASVSPWLTGVHRMYKATTGEFMYTPAATEAVSATKYGYVDTGVQFYATPRAVDSCEIGVRRLYNRKYDSFRNAVDGSVELARYVAAGWVDQGSSFFVMPAATSDPAPSTSASTPSSTSVPTSSPAPSSSSTSAPTPTSSGTSTTPASSTTAPSTTLSTTSSTTTSSPSTASTTAAPPTTIPTTTTVAPPVDGSNPLSRIGYVWQTRYNGAWNAYSTAAGGSLQQWNDWQIANNATAIWLGYMPGIQGQINAIESMADAQGKAPIIVLYGVPQVGCGSYSTGAPSDAAYRQWVDGINAGLAGRPAVLIVEPDAIGMCPGWSDAQRAARNGDLTYANKTLAQGDPAAFVYLHAGSESDPALWSAQHMQAAGVQYTRGFATNISSFHNTAAEIAWGKQVQGYLAAAGLGDKRFVIDTSRSGALNTGGGCDLQNALIGPRPTTRTADPAVDAYLWVQQPGHSDHCGNIPGDPGGWWQAYADLLVGSSLGAGTIAAIPGP